jgi:transglutaminase-like putative cysteine protease
VAVPLTTTMPPLTGRSQLGYLLTLPEGAEFVLDQDRQQLTGNLLTVTLENLDAYHAPACRDRQEALAATPYIQATNRVILETAHTVSKNISADFDKVRQLADWVFKNLEKRPVLGIPDALTTLHSRRGDCNEHAALFAALARSINIPTRVAAGVTYHEGFFYYHAWNEVCLGKNWLSLDTTKNQLPADLTHIKFVEGEIKDMVQIGALIGNLAIAVAAGPEESR